MTNSELADLVCGPDRRAISVSMSKKGIFLRVGDSHHTITEEQAGIVWLAMQEMMRPAHPSDTRPERGEG